LSSAISQGIGQNNAKNITGRTDGLAPSAGYIGEVVEAYQSGATVSTTLADTEIDVTGATITLTAGEWDIYYSTTLSLNRASGTGGVFGRARITDSSNVALSETETPIAISNPASGSADVWQQNSIMRRLAFTGASRTYKLRITCSVAAASGNLTSCQGSMTAAITGSEGTTYIRAVRRA
jgi:hypothetical protein